MIHRVLLTIALALVLAACATSGPNGVQKENLQNETSRNLTEQHSEPRIDASRLSSIVKVLASEEFEGRAPGTPGEQKTIAYLEQQFAALGLEPGGDDGGWTQAVPLIHTQIEAPASVTLSIGGQELALQQERDIEISTVQAIEHIFLHQAPVVFVGYGADAPERQWDDFGDIDLTNKVALFLVNDPDFAAEPHEEVAGRVWDRPRTYNGRRGDRSQPTSPTE